MIEMHLDDEARRDICCEDDTSPCLLKTHPETVGGRDYLVSGVRLHDFFCQDARHTNVWKTKWWREMPYKAHNHLADLTSSYYSKHPELW